MCGFNQQPTSDVVRETEAAARLRSDKLELVDRISVELVALRDASEVFRRLVAFAAGHLGPTAVEADPQMVEWIGRVAKAQYRREAVKIAAEIGAEAVASKRMEA